MDEIIDPVAHDGERNAPRATKAGKRRERWIDVYFVQRSVQLALGCANERHLALHAFCRPDGALFPFLFNAFPIGTGKTAQYEIGGVLNRDRSIKIAEYAHGSLLANIEARNVPRAP